jgi:peptide/nickel transport system substrate-binding protein
MSEHHIRNLQEYLQARATRRKVVGGLGAGIALAGAGFSVSGQSSTPVIDPAGSPAASPAASPVASPVATPLPDPVPPTSLTIVREQRPVAAGTPVKGGDLRLFVRGADLTSFSPVAQRQDFQVPISFMDPLVWIDEVTMEPKPWLATSWTWSKDGLSLTFELRDDVTFHDGSPLTPADVAFSLVVYRDDYQSANANFLALVNRVDATGDRGVTVSFDEPDGAFLFNAANLPIFKRAQYESQWGKDIPGERSLNGYNWSANVPLGTGPWKIDEVRNDGITLVRHDNYWAGAPNFDRLILTAEDDQRKRLDAWRKGEADIVWPVRSTEMGDLWDEEGYLYVAEAPVVFFAAFNFANPANATPEMMRDPALREALSLAVDRRGYARETFFDFIAEKKAGTITQPWAHDDSLANPDFDIDRANQVLDEGGWQDVDGDGLREDAASNKLDLYCIVAETERPELLAILDRLGEDFAKIGARLTVQRLNPDAFDARWTENRQYDMIALSLTQYAAFAEYDLYGSAWDIRSNRTGWNPGGYSNETVDAAINEYFAAWNIDDMRAALTKLQRAANEDLFGLWFGFPHDLALVRDDIQGFVPNKMYQTWGTRHLWRGEAQEPGPTPAASPLTSPEASPMATPVS